MIRLTRLNGSEFSLNPDLIHRAEETPDTVLTLIDGSRYVVVEPLEELITRIVGYRARVVATAGRLSTADDGAHLHVCPPVDGGPDGFSHYDLHSDDVRSDDRADHRSEENEGADVVRLRARRA